METLHVNNERAHLIFRFFAASRCGVQSRSFVILWTKKLYRRVPIEYPWSCCTIILFLRTKHLVLPKNI